MKTIETKYLPPTNARGARIKAFSRDGIRARSVIIPFRYDDAYNGHLDAIREWVRRYLSVDQCEMVVGGTNDGMVAVFADDVRIYVKGEAK